VAQLRPIPAFPSASVAAVAARPGRCWPARTAATPRRTAARRRSQEVAVAAGCSSECQLRFRRPTWTLGPALRWPGNGAPVAPAAALKLMTLRRCPAKAAAGGRSRRRRCRAQAYPGRGCRQAGLQRQCHRCRAGDGRKAVAAAPSADTGWPRERAQSACMERHHRPEKANRRAHAPYRRKALCIKHVLRLRGRISRISQAGTGQAGRSLGGRGSFPNPPNIISMPSKHFRCGKS
jgi:hypothetical protein